MDELFRQRPTLAVTSILGSPMSTRLEPQSISGDPATGLQAQVWDPLWLLGRQWQLGEWKGEDTGTPLTVRVRASFEPLVAWRPGAPATPTDPDGHPWQPLPPEAVLESLTDAEPSTGPSPRALALAGWALLEELEDLGETKAATVLRRRYPLEDVAHGGPPEAEDDVARATLTDTWSPVAASLVGRSIDPLAVARALDKAHRPGWWRKALRPWAAGQDAAEQALEHWLRWVREEVAPTASQDPASWLGPRLEYEFALATPTCVLRAPAHAGGEASWSSFDLATSQTPPESDAPTRRLDRTVLATPLAFAGMPASRFWELEDGRVDLGSVWADPHELARLLVVECALVHGGDWLVVPVDVPAGGVVTLESVTYADTFGTTWEVTTSGADTPRWRMFTISPSEGAQEHLPGLLVPPAQAGRLEGAPIEDVGFLRDEAANMVWALEHLVPGPGGDPVVPRGTAPPARVGPGVAGEEVVLDYQLMTHLPETWTPYLPRLGSLVVDPGEPGPAVVLVRGHQRRYGDDGSVRPVEPSGTLLRGDEHRWVESGEVPREGVRVQRVPVVARRGDGSWATWTARRVLVGRGEAESGLRFDVAARPRG